MKTYPREQPLGRSRKLARDLVGARKLTVDGTRQPLGTFGNSALKLLFERQLIIQHGFLDDALDALIFAHNHKVQSDWRGQVPGSESDFQYKDYTRRRYYIAFLKQFLKTEAVSLNRATRKPESIIATLVVYLPSLKPTTYFIDDRGFLLHFVKLAQLAMLVYGCSIEQALEFCITEKPQMVPMPDDMTIKALDYIVTSYRIDQQAPSIESQFAALPWTSIRKDLKLFLADDVRSEIIREKKFDPGEGPKNHEYPKFCQTDKECQSRLTKAAVTTFRLYAEPEPIPDGPRGHVIWHKRHGNYLRDFFESGELTTQAFQS